MASDARIIAVDIGTSKIRVCLFDTQMKLRWFEEKNVEIIYELDNDILIAEMEPDILWKQFKELVELAVHQAGGSSFILSCGICTQRNTFCSWNKSTLEPCHRLVVWKDMRAKDVCKEWNHSFTVKSLNTAGKFAHFLTRSERFKAAKMFQFINTMVTQRFLVTLEKNETMKSLLDNGTLAFGCIDTWLMSKLSNGKLYLSETSCASSTGLFDPFLNDWGHTILRLIKFPVSLLPDLVDTVTDGKPFMTVDESIFGFPLKIGALIADQQSALFGAGCLTQGSMKISLGTGTFVDLVTGSSPHASMHGLYPLVGWRTKNIPLFIAEGKSDDTATLLNWALSIGLCSDISETSTIAQLTTAEPNLHFVPAFGGIQTPLNDDNACSAFLGIRPETSKEQMIRAILEAIAFRVYQIWQTLEDEVAFQIGNTVRICGGVAQNDFVCQTIATLINRPVERLVDGQFTAAKGAALLAGVSSGLWSLESSTNLINVQQTFVPDLSYQSYLLSQFSNWNKAVQRCLKFYNS
uniref:Glycerol kinase n=1 Tax=Panagrolaimus sp. PS1159 TaxID=55785 RepID=A0AC35FXR6_9BILA